MELFGNPVLNNFQWEKIQLNKLIKIEGGWSPPCSNKMATDSEWGVLKVSSVTNCDFNDRENKAINPHVSPRHEKEVQLGDILFTRTLAVYPARGIIIMAIKESFQF